jgi:hypothetical protein
MLEKKEPLKFYQDPFYYVALISLVFFVLFILSIMNKISDSFLVPSIIIMIVTGGLAYYMWNTRCPMCKRPFAKKEDDEKEKDLGIRKIKREFTSKIYKTSDGTEVDYDYDYKIWPARFVQRFFHCNKCGYGKHNEWHDSEEGVFKKWENEDQWNPPSPKIIKVKENEDGGYTPLSGGKKRIPIKKSQKINIYKRANNRCQHCGHDNGLEIHHIDENPANNNMGNLILLCANCHKKVIPIGKIALKNEAQKSYGKSKTINVYKNS